MNEGQGPKPQAFRRGEFTRDPRSIDVPQIEEGSEFDTFGGSEDADDQEHVAGNTDEVRANAMLYRAESSNEMPGIADLMDSTQGRIADGIVEIDVRIHPDQQSSGPLPGHEGTPRLPTEIREAEAALRRLETAVQQFDATEIEAARAHIIHKDPDVVLYKAISEVVALRNTPRTTGWQPRLEKLAKGYVNELAQAADLARRHLLDYPHVAGAVIQLSVFIERYAVAYFPAQAELQQQRAASARTERAQKFKQRGLAGVDN